MLGERVILGRRGSYVPFLDEDLFGTSESLKIIGIVVKRKIRSKLLGSIHKSIINGSVA